MSVNTKLTIGEKRDKIKSNYETIGVLKSRLNDSKDKQKLGMSRAAYIKMIYDVTKKVEQQNAELANAIQEVRHIQKDVSNLGGRLDRSFVFLKNDIAARKDGWSHECYSLLHVMHEHCDQLIGAIQQTGEMTREMRQLEEQISQLKSSCL